MSVEFETASPACAFESCHGGLGDLGGYVLDNGEAEGRESVLLRRRYEGAVNTSLMEFDGLSHGWIRKSFFLSMKFVICAACSAGVSGLTV